MVAGGTIKIDMAITIRGSSAENVFRLLGSDENSASYALGWALERSSHFRNAMLDAWKLSTSAENGDISISLQRYGPDKGYTDVEIRSGNNFHAIVEAKRSWELPSNEQLQKYRPRLAAYGAGTQRLVTISSASSEFARRRLPREIGGALIVHQSWTDVRRLASFARGQASSFEEKLWLRSLSDHLKEFVAMDRVTNNSVYVVSLSPDVMVPGGTHTWIDVVERDRCYFHPIGGSGWPVQPPNYIGFRHHGKLQSVHHIDSYEMTEDVSSVNPLWLKTDVAHFVYHLGPAMLPASEMRTGNLFRAARVSCAIDTLLSGEFQTLSDAAVETKRRQNQPQDV
jgi:hypothetical protein